MTLHPRTIDSAWPTFIRGKHDTEVFEAFRKVEVAVRTACGYDAKVTEVSLMRQTFYLTMALLPTGHRQRLSANRSVTSSPIPWALSGSPLVGCLKVNITSAVSI